MFSVIAKSAYVKRNNSNSFPFIDDYIFGDRVTFDQMKGIWLK